MLLNWFNYQLLPNAPTNKPLAAIGSGSQSSAKLDAASFIYLLLGSSPVLFKFGRLLIRVVLLLTLGFAMCAGGGINWLSRVSPLLTWCVWAIGWRVLTLLHCCP